MLDDRDLGQETAREGRFGYASRHLLVTPDDPAPASYDDLAGHRASIQVRTVLQHAWAEFEHDIRYKGTVPAEHALDLDRRFTLAAGLLELADQEFSAIRERLQGRRPAPAARGGPERPADQRAGARDVPRRRSTPTPAGRTPTTTAGSPGCSSSSASPRSTSSPALLTSVDPDAIIRRMGYRYPAGAVRRLDDALLAIFGRQYVDLTGNAHRVPLLTARLEKLSTPGT